MRDHEPDTVTAVKFKITNVFHRNGWRISIAILDSVYFAKAEQLDEPNAVVSSKGVSTGQALIELYKRIAEHDANLILQSLNKNNNHEQG